MTARITVLVTDTSPLLTLALGDSLDALLQLGLPIIIPDAVYTEATRIVGAPGASRIVEGLDEHLEARVVMTETGVDQLRRIEEGRSIRGMGESAVFELTKKILARDEASEVLLLFEDSDIEKTRPGLDSRIILIATGEFLHELENLGLIQSADRILDMAALQGRNVDKLRRMRAAERRAIRER